MQTGRMRGKGVGETLRNILEKEGVGGLFRCCPDLLLTILIIMKGSPHVGLKTTCMLLVHAALASTAAQRRRLHALKNCKLLCNAGLTLEIRSWADCISSVLNRGNGASVLRIVPYAALHFGAYEYYRELLVKAAAASVGKGVEEYDVPPALDLVAGSAAGATAVLVRSCAATCQLWAQHVSWGSASSPVGTLYQLIGQETTAVMGSTPGNGTVYHN